eukprot:SM000428S16069  [mRNA]  locus=s428:22336:24018:- [translate_table: standard]
MLQLLFTSSGAAELASPVLLVDGYNLCGAWPRLKKPFHRGQLEVARDRLIAELATFSAVKGVRVLVCFDAQVSGCAPRKETVNNVEVVFATSSEADAWIEHEARSRSRAHFHWVKLLVADGCPKVWVATSDRSLQLTAHGLVCPLLPVEWRSQQPLFLQDVFIMTYHSLFAVNAPVMIAEVMNLRSHSIMSLHHTVDMFLLQRANIWGCAYLISEIKDAKKELQELMQEENPYSFSGKLLEDNLDDDVREGLKSLRRQLVLLEPD